MKTLRKLLLVTLLLMGWSTLRAQPTDKATINYSLTANFVFNDSLNSTTISWIARDESDEHTVNRFAMFYGSPKDCYSFLSKIDAFFSLYKRNINKSVSFTDAIDGHKVVLLKCEGLKVCRVYSVNGEAYTDFSPQRLKLFVYDYVAWCKENGVSYE
jgi:hypothetical protein